jgi:signal transduction histidine kinase
MESMRLSDFITANLEPIIREWETFARSILPGANMESLALRDHAEEILLATVNDMRASPSDNLRGRSHASIVPAALNDASELHAHDRLGSGFDLMEVVSEYQALRASVLELWQASSPSVHANDVHDLNAFHRSIDRSLAAAVNSYTKRVDQSRDLFLAILSHDLRNPLNSIGMSAQGMLNAPGADGEPSPAAQIFTNVSMMGRMIGDLLDYTRTRLGAGMPVTPVPTDLRSLCRELCSEYLSAHPHRALNFESHGDTQGTWDPDRLRQAISNLLGNAFQHGDAYAPIELRVVGDASNVSVSIHSDGNAIHPGEITKIFEPMVRGSSADSPIRNRPGSIGLGLYIAREVARSHGGSIEVVSTAAAGTTFTIHLPRHCLTKSAPSILNEAHVQTM